ncbi:MAG: hypothetical protein AAFY05_01250 [Pseudomonadota bacterium]
MDPVTFCVLIALLTLCLPIRWSACACGLVTAYCLFTLATVPDASLEAGLVRGIAGISLRISLVAMVVRLCVWSAVFVYRNTPPR